MNIRIAMLALLAAAAMGFSALAQEPPAPAVAADAPPPAGEMAPPPAPDAPPAGPGVGRPPRGREGPGQGGPGGPGGPERPGRQEHGRMRVPPIFRDVTDDEAKEILGFVNEHMPWLAEGMEGLKTNDPDRYKQMLRRMRFEVAQLRRLREEDEGAFRKAIEERRVRMQSFTLMTKLRAAQDPAAKEALTAELRGVLNHMFELEMVTRETQIRGLQERLESLRKEIDQRAAHRAEIVEQRLQEMLKDRPPEERSPEDRPDGPPDDGPGKRDGRGPPRAP